MTKHQTIFLQLLKIGLGSQADVDFPILDNDALNDLYRLASEQAVRGFVFEGLQKINPNRNGGVEAILEWYATVSQIEQRNLYINNAIPEILTFFSEEGYHPIMMKGQVVALEYATPLKRESGDIDLYFSEGEGVNAIETVRSRFKSVRVESIRDVSFNYKDIIVEVHPYLVHCSRPSDNKYEYRLQKWFEEILESFPTQKIGDTDFEVAVPNPLFHVIYIFYHLWIHFVKGGIGLRQICDWGMFLHNNHGKIDIEELHRKLEYFGLLRPWIGFAGILVDYLGLSSNEIPFYKKSNKTDKILALVFKEGNFGHNIQKDKEKKSNKIGKIITASLGTMSCYLRICHIFPIDAVRFLPGIKSLKRYCAS